MAACAAALPIYFCFIFFLLFNSNYLFPFIHFLKEICKYRKIWNACQYVQYIEQNKNFSQI